MTTLDVQYNIFPPVIIVGGINLRCQSYFPDFNRFPGTPHEFARLIGKKLQSHPHTIFRSH